MKFIQVRGCMGSGKTSIVRQFIKSCSVEVCFIEVWGKEYPYTYDRSKNIIICGRYDKCVCGGTDGIIRGKELVREYITRILKTLHPNLLIFEGVMYGITFKFTHDLSKLAELCGYEFIAIAPIAPFDVIVERISIRNGGKQFNVESLERNYSRYLQSTKKLEQSKVDIRYFNTVDYRKDDMHKILEACL